MFRWETCDLCPFSHAAIEMKRQPQAEHCLLTYNCIYERNHDWKVYLFISAVQYSFSTCIKYRTQPVSNTDPHLHKSHAHRRKGYIDTYGDMMWWDISSLKHFENIFYVQDKSSHQIHGLFRKKKFFPQGNKFEQEKRVSVPKVQIPVAEQEHVTNRCMT